MNKCINCGKECIKKYCSELCFRQYHNAKKYNQYEEGKIQCLICGGWYKKICSHVVQRHNMTSSEYKELAGYNRVGGVMCEKSKEVARKRIMENYEVAIQQNLLEKGKKTRLKKGNKLRNGKLKRKPNI